jgi:hypothetical protein
MQSSGLVQAVAFSIVALLLLRAGARSKRAA